MTQPTDSPLARIKLALVDDHDPYLRMLKAMADGLGFRQIFTAASCASAREMLQEVRPDILVLDYRLGDGDGIALTQWIRASNTPLKFIPVIMLSGYANREMVNAARDGGVTEFLAKPISPRDLFRRLATIVDRPRPFVRTKGYFGPDRRRRESPFKGPERRLLIPFKGVA